MAQGTLPKIERNMELLTDYNNGMSMPDLCAKYDLTTKRIYDIINNNGGQANRRKPKKKKNSEESVD